MEIGGAEESYLGAHPTRARETPRARNTENADHSHRSLQLNPIQFIWRFDIKQCQYRRIHISDVRGAIGGQFAIIEKYPLHNFRIDRAVVAAPRLFVRLDQVLWDAAEGGLPGDAVAVVVGDEEVGDHVRI